MKALLVDSWYDAYLGVVVLVRIVDGELKKGQKIRMMAPMRSIRSNASASSRPRQETVERLGPGEVGFITAAIKQVADTRVGDTITDEKEAGQQDAARLQAGAAGGVLRPVPGRCGDFETLREALGKLHLNDASFTYEMETSAALGFGFRCGFLGLLHLEIVRERLEREFNLDLIATAPSVIYRIHMKLTAR